MGYFKSQIVADQVELGDRIPTPKPAGSVFPSRRLHRNAQKRHRNMMRSLNRRLLLDAVVYIGMGIIFGAFVTFVVVAL
jgi:hypothetical protein